TTTPAAAVTTPAAAVTTTTPAAAVTTTTPAAAVTTTTSTIFAVVASTDPPSSSEGILKVQFSLNQTFNSDLSNTSSSAFKNLAAKVQSDVNKVFAGTPGFRHCIVNLFRNGSGSVVTDMTLVYDKQSSVPSSSSAQTILANSSTSLNILPGSISVVSGSAPRPTAFTLAALALLMVQLLG
ncbi:cell wall protein DAN4-like, partial [Salmo salar]|uniref:Cell wall protein DAN4-like n=1 Tax=Salmo salar TaxID=8030 RepID=A0ABM3ECA7_SALSA